jgi:hypothetical protein
MRTKTLALAAAVLALAALPALAGEYHAGAANVCYDCHTMHYSMQHEWESGTGPIVPGSPSTGGNWLGTGGPFHYLLKADANAICLQCHDGQTFAPDVYGVNTNAGSQIQGRSAGALNGEIPAYGFSPGAGYDDWKGHTLDSTATPPGFDPELAGWSATIYTPADGLKCFNCHTQHGRPTAYRNLGPRSSSNPSGQFIVSYAISTTFDGTKDVTINLPAHTAGTEDAATFAPYYDQVNTRYSRNDMTHGSGNLISSNNIDRQCSACHGQFHGGPLNEYIGGEVYGAGWEKFERHPTSGVNIGALGGGHSNLARYVAATNKVKVYTQDQVSYTSSSPGCISCHKAHGNQNPFGLIFMGRLDAVTPSEEGTTSDVDLGLRNLCGQCHGQGN